VLAHLVEGVVTERVLTYIGLDAWEEPKRDDGSALNDAERQLAHAEAQLSAFLADDELREVVGRDSFLAEARKRQQAVDTARQKVEAATGGQAGRRAAPLPHGGRVGQVAERKREGPAGRHAAALPGDCLRPRGTRPRRAAGAAPVAGGGPLRAPERGTTDYVVRTIPWPDWNDRAAALASVPEWAWRNGHPAVPKHQCAHVHEMARRENLPWYLPESEAA
jgi:multidrug efflux pump subunit AcrA (membrane-fusion protein)